MKSNLNLGLLVLRLSLGVLLLLHGVSKLQFGIDWMVKMLEAKGIQGWSLLQKPNYNGLHDA